MEIILASGSPRRAKLMQQMGLHFEIVKSGIKEGKLEKPWINGVQELAKAKALAVSGCPGQVILGADTIVVQKDVVFGKPQNAQQAREMLRILSGCVHEVMTGICIVKYMENENDSVRIYQDVEVTRVYFRSLSNKEIEAYVESGESQDKAGAYGIQGLGALLVDKIEGCYFNVVGLPVAKTMQLLRQCGVPILGGR